MGENGSAEERLWEEALELVMRLQSEPDDSAWNDIVRDWRARSPDHAAAWQEIAEIHGMTGTLVRANRKAKAASVTRRKLLLGGGAGLGAVAAAAVFGPRLLLELEADYTSPKASIATVPLNDGTTVTLGPESAIKLAYSEVERRVELLSGMAYFDVASDPVRPFVTRSGHVSATAIGTAFEIGADAGFTSVSVGHGEVVVESAGASIGGSGERLAAGQWLSLDERGGTIERGVREAGQIAAWREGLLIVDRETVAAVVARISRWQQGVVLIADFSFGSLPVSGVYDLRQPLQALAALAHPYGGRVRQISPWLTVITKI